MIFLKIKNRNFPKFIIFLLSIFFLNPSSFSQERHNANNLEKKSFEFAVRTIENNRTVIRTLYSDGDELIIKKDVACHPEGWYLLMKLDGNPIGEIKIDSAEAQHLFAFYSNKYDEFVKKVNQARIRKSAVK